MFTFLTAGLWSLADAAYRVVEMVHEMKSERDNMSQSLAADATPDSTTPAASGTPHRSLMELQMKMRDHIITKLDPLVAPFRDYDADNCQMVLSTLLDPRFCRGRVFFRMQSGSGDKAARMNAAKALLDRCAHLIIIVSYVFTQFPLPILYRCMISCRYTDERLLPMAVSVAKFLAAEEDRKRHVAANANTDHVDDNDESNVDLLAGGDQPNHQVRHAYYICNMRLSYCLFKPGIICVLAMQDSMVIIISQFRWSCVYKFTHVDDSLLTS
jgi:hypothetical protein